MKKPLFGNPKVSEAVLARDEAFRGHQGIIALDTVILRTPHPLPPHPHPKKEVRQKCSDLFFILFFSCFSLLYWTSRRPSER